MAVSEKKLSELTKKERKHLNKITNVCERCGWSVKLNEDYVLLGNESPLGEDISFEISVDSPASDIYMAYEDFDVDDHVEMLVPMRGTRGVPDSIGALVHDAEEIEKMLEELYMAVEKVF